MIANHCTATTAVTHTNQFVGHGSWDTVLKFYFKLTVKNKFSKIKLFENFPLYSMCICVQCGSCKNITISSENCLHTYTYIILSASVQLGTLAAEKTILNWKILLHWDKSFAQLYTFSCKEYSGETATPT